MVSFLRRGYEILFRTSKNRKMSGRKKDRVPLTAAAAGTRRSGRRGPERIVVEQLVNKDGSKIMEILKI